MALLAAVAVLFSSGASGRTQYLCHLTGRVLTDCCCAAEAPQRAPRVQQLRATDCCDRLVTAARSGATGIRDAVSRVPGAALVAVLPWQPPPPPLPSEQVALVFHATRAPPAVGPPLFVAHCAFLI